MREFFRTIDRLLRGEFTRRERLVDGRIAVPATSLIVTGLVLGGIYGAFMGMYGLMRPGHRTFEQLLASIVKVPLLFLLTLFVTFPSLYVFSALANSRARFSDTLRLLLAVVAVTLALLASFGPITAFFTLSTDSYPFMILLNVIFFAIAGAVGLSVLRSTLTAVLVTPAASEPDDDLAAAGAESTDAQTTPPAQPMRRLPAPRSSDASLTIFRVWIVIYGVVGAQMGWILRPFIGNPELPFTWFRPRESNFFAALVRVIEKLLSP